MITFNDVETVRASQELHKSIALKYFVLRNKWRSYQFPKHLTASHTSPGEYFQFLFPDTKSSLLKIAAHKIFYSIIKREQTVRGAQILNINIYFKHNWCNT